MVVVRRREGRRLDAVAAEIGATAIVVRRDAEDAIRALDRRGRGRARARSTCSARTPVSSLLGGVDASDDEWQLSIDVN